MPHINSFKPSSANACILQHRINLKLKYLQICSLYITFAPTVFERASTPDDANHNAIQRSNSYKPLTLCATLVKSSDIPKYKVELLLKHSSKFCCRVWLLVCCRLWILCQTIQHRAVLIIFPVNLQTITITRMLSSRGKRPRPWNYQHRLFFAAVRPRYTFCAHVFHKIAQSLLTSTF